MYVWSVHHGGDLPKHSHFTCCRQGAGEREASSLYNLSPCPFFLLWAARLSRMLLERASNWRRRKPTTARAICCQTSTVTGGTALWRWPSYSIQNSLLLEADKECSYFTPQQHIVMLFLLQSWSWQTYRVLIPRCWQREFWQIRTICGKHQQMWLVLRPSGHLCQHHGHPHNIQLRPLPM